MFKRTLNLYPESIENSKNFDCGQPPLDGLLEMKLSQLIARLQAVAEELREATVLIGRNDGSWYDEVEGIRACQITRDKGLTCGPHRIEEDGEETVIVIQ